MFEIRSYMKSGVHQKTEARIRKSSQVYKVEEVWLLGAKEEKKTAADIGAKISNKKQKQLVSVLC